LQNGHNFVFPTQKYNKLNDQVEAKYLFSQLNYISKQHLNKNFNIKQFIKNFKVLCESYICKHNKWIKTDKELKIIREFFKQQNLYFVSIAVVI
jgi:hypothetical protein